MDMSMHMYRPCVFMYSPLTPLQGSVWSDCDSFVSDMLVTFLRAIQGLTIQF